MLSGCYIAGPMRGIKHLNHEVFDAAEDWLTANTSFRPIYNPAAFNVGYGLDAIALNLHGAEFDGMDWLTIAPGQTFDLSAAMEHGKEFIRSNECGAVIMLPGWQRSEGARTQKVLGESLGRRIQYLRTDEDGETYIWHEPEEITVETEQMGLPDLEPATVEVRVTSPTGGQKGAKAERHGLIPGYALDVVSRIYAFGAEKYDDNNWRKGYAWSLSLDALLRHINALKKGEWLDPESGLPHLGHAAFHCLTVLEWAETGYTDQNDIYGLVIE